MPSVDVIQTNSNTVELPFISLQLSYSTADIEGSLFFAPEYTPPGPSEPTSEVTLLVVHGDLYALEEGPFPQPSVPLTEESGVFRIVGLDQQA